MSKTSEKGIELIQYFEGLRLNAYKCPAGVWTIGYGHTKTAERGLKISKERAIELLRADLEYFEGEVHRLVGPMLNQSEFDALVSFTYNIGIGAFGKSTLLRKLNSHDFKGASNEFLRWNKAGGRVLSGLVKRRKAERQLFLEGN